MSVEGDLEVMPPSPSQVVPMEILRPRPSVFYGEEARRTGNFLRGGGGVLGQDLLSLLWQFFLIYVSKALVFKFKCCF